MKFGEKIKELRTQKKMSQTELGKAVGVSLRTVRGWEVEGRYPRHKDPKQAQMILEQTAAMFAGGDLSDEDQIEFLNEIQTLYLDSKKRAKKFTPKKYRSADSE